MDKLSKSKQKINKILDCLKKGMLNKDIAKLVDCDTSYISQVKSKYYTDITDNKIEILDDIKEIESLSLIKAKILNLISIDKLSLASAKSLVDMYSIISNQARLLQGKSTENIAINNIHSLDKKQLSIIKNAVSEITANAMKLNRLEHKKTDD
jgi:plasmid maintenance system killer protein